MILQVRQGNDKVRALTLHDYALRHVELLLNPLAAQCCDRSYHALPLVTSWAALPRLALLYVAHAVFLGPRPSVGSWLLVLPLLLVSGALFTVGFTVTERVLYLPSAGLSLLLAAAEGRAARWAGRGTRVVLRAGLGLAALGGAALTHQNSLAWHDGARLYTQVCSQKLHTPLPNTASEKVRQSFDPAYFVYCAVAGDLAQFTSLP